MKRWYTTVGVPGGEFARRAMSRDNACRLLAESLGLTRGYPPDSINVTQIEQALRRGEDDVLVRPASPELAEWLDATTHGQGLGDGGDCRCNPDSRWKVPGGWLYFGGAGESAGAAFVPVAGAAGITVIGETND